MIKTLIFDLSEVLIAGLFGIEKPLSARLTIPEEKVLPAFAGELLHDLFCARLSEDDYIDRILAQQGWHISPDDLKLVIRNNFHREVPGMLKLVNHLAANYELALFSDHAAEWIVYIQSIHSFFQIFTMQFYSFQLGQTKREESAFLYVLNAINRKPEECVFIDDSPANVAVAEKVGILGRRFTTAQALSRQLMELDIG